jgi:ArsR family transcriptional regulator
MLILVLERECCVCEIMQAMDISQSKASRGLTALCDAGFLKQRKDGLWSLYSIDENMEDYLSDLLSAAKKALKNSPATARTCLRLSVNMSRRSWIRRAR